MTPLPDVISRLKLEMALLLMCVGLTVSLSYGSPSMSANGGGGGKNCERIQVDLCLDTPYNFTRMPNMLGNPDQQSAAYTIHDYKALIDAKCSNNLKFFLCSMFTPMCTDAIDQAITSCRSVCEEVKKNCMPLLGNFGLPWPDTLNCSQFPVKGEHGILCMDPYPPGDVSAPVEPPKDKGQLNQKFPTPGVTQTPACGQDFIATDANDQVCSLSCKLDWMFSSDHKDFAEIWTFVWSMMCFVVTLFTVVTFCLDRSRFRYPERPIIFLSFCYNLYSFGYLLRYFLKAESVKCHELRDKDRRSILISGGLDNSNCVIVFMISYYFANACAIWWVILSLTWFLAAARKWGQEAIASISQFFHLVAWGLPALMTIAVMITHSVDASELTGVCYVGQQNPVALLGYVIAPMSLFLIVGVGFIGAGLLAMARIRREMRHQERDTDLIKLEKLMVRIGIFSLLYSLPAIVVIACCIYEFNYLRLWMEPAKATCNSYTDSGKCREWSKTRPKVEIYMLKIFMGLAVGITCGMWVLSRKTFSTWRRVLTCGLLQGPGAKFVRYQPAGAQQLVIPSSTPLPAAAVPLMSLNLHASTTMSRYGCSTPRTTSEASAKL